MSDQITDTAKPDRAAAIAETGILTDYRCDDCGNRWRASATPKAVVPCPSCRSLAIIETPVSAIRPEVRELLALDPLTYSDATAIVSRVLNQRDQREWERAQAVDARGEMQRLYENAVDEREGLRAYAARLSSALRTIINAPQFYTSEHHPLIREARATLASE